MKQNNVKPIPVGYHTMTPYLTIKNADLAIEFYKKAFDAIEITPPFRDSRGKIAHAELKIGDSIFKLMDESSTARSPEAFGGTPVGIALYVEDADRTFNHAIAAGAKSVHPVKNQFYGDRIGKIEDPLGHRWSISTHVENISSAEMEKRVAARNDPLS